MKKSVPLLASVLLLAGLIYFAGPAELFSIISKADKKVILAGIALWSIAATIRTLRWQRLLREAGIRIPFALAFRVFNAGLFLSIITPGKVGDPARSALLKRASGESFSKSLPTIVVERVFDVTVIMLLGLLGMLSLPLGSVKSYFLTASLFYAAAIAFIIFVVSSRARMESMLNFFLGVVPFFPQAKGLREKVGGFSEGFHTSMTKFRRPNTLLLTLFLTLAIWLIEGLIFYLAFYSIGLKISYSLALGALTISVLVSVLSFLPGGLGSSEFVLALLFGSVMGFGLAQVTSAAFIGRLMSFWMTALVGLIFLSTLPRHSKQT